MDNYTQVIQEIRKLNRKLLSLLESEFDVLVEDNPELKDTMNQVFRRMKKNIFDIIGSCERDSVLFLNEHKIFDKCNQD